MTQLNVKGGSIKKTKRIPVIICSNYSVEDTFKNAVEKDDKILDSLKARFYRFKMGKPFD